MKYVVYRQPLSLDRFFIHDVSPSEAQAGKLEHAFILINLNRFQQIVSVFTFQAETEQMKVTFMNFPAFSNISALKPLFTLQNNWLQKLREAQEMWKRTLQTTVFRESQHFNNNSIDASNDCHNVTSMCPNQSPPNRSVPHIV